MLKEPLTAARILGALTIVAGLAVIGGEAVTSIGAHGLAGDLMFVVTGAFFATFGMLLRLWRIDAIRATVVVSVLSLVADPDPVGVRRLRADDRARTLGKPAPGGGPGHPGGPRGDLPVHPLGGAARRRPRRGVSRRWCPASRCWSAISRSAIVPSIPQLLGFAIVLIGFRLTQKP